MDAYFFYKNIHVKILTKILDKKFKIKILAKYFLKKVLTIGKLYDIIISENQREKGNKK